MRGFAPLIRFPVDWYLDNRKAEWVIDERMGYVLYQSSSEGHLVYVHAERAGHIVHTLRRCWGQVVLSDLVSGR